MSSASRLEDLDVWIAARSLVRCIYQVTTASGARNDFGYRDQIRRAAVSVMSNIAEGFGRSSDKEFARFLDIARGSAFETQSLIHVGTDVGYLEKDASCELVKSTLVLIAQITALIRYLRQSEGPRSKVQSPRS